MSVERIECIEGLLNRPSVDTPGKRAEREARTVVCDTVPRRPTRREATTARERVSMTDRAIAKASDWRNA
jgi:hypothetical protein